MLGHLLVLSHSYLYLTGTPGSIQSETPSQSIHSAGTPATPISPPDQSEPINFSGSILSTALIDPHTVIQQNRTLCDMSQDRQLAVLLDCWSYFRDSILAVSTLKGKEHYSALNQETLRTILFHTCPRTIQTYER